MFTYRDYTLATRVFLLSFTWMLVQFFGEFVRAQNDPPAADTERVGFTDPNRAVTPVYQITTPFGRNIDLDGLRPQALALSPDGKFFVTAGKTNELIVLDPVAAKIKQRVPVPGLGKATYEAPVSDQVLRPGKDDQLSFNGLIFSPKGDRIYLSNVAGAVCVFSVSPTGEVQPYRS